MARRLSFLSLVLVFTACQQLPEEPRETQELSVSPPIVVWMDVDPAVMRGGHEPDDGLALVQAFHSPELLIEGVSVVFGNSPLDQGYPIGQEITERYGPDGLAVFSGAASGAELGEETHASTALTEALRQQKLTVLALGPVTNVATVLKNHPELAGQMEAIIAVAGRRPGQTFQLGDGGKPLRDLNFELDPKGFQVLLDSGVPIVLAPFEISAKVPLYETEDLARFQGTAFGEYFWEPIQDYVDWYDERFNLRAIYPFDTLAVAYLTSPEWIQCEELPVEIQVLPDDANPDREKPYLLVSAELETSHRALYCHTAREPFKEDLIRRLLAE
jgi:pyrimidine-specific ribonucleoside hydrolase